jgi:hypothetical protein
VFGAPAGEAPTHVLRTPNREFACGLHIVPARSDGVYVGATNRASRHPGAAGAVTVDEIAYLLDGVTAELVGCIAGWEFRRSRFGNRPLAADRCPIVGRTSVEGLSVATGTYRNGVLLAPLLADVLRGEMARNAPDPNNQLSPVPAQRVRTERPEAGQILREGLGQLPRVLRTSRDRRWRERVEHGLAVLYESGGILPPSAEQLLRTYPLVEMVPELLIELGEEGQCLQSPAVGEGRA